MFKSIEMINKDVKTSDMLIRKITEKGNQNVIVTKKSPRRIFFLKKTITEIKLTSPYIY